MPKAYLCRDRNVKFILHEKFSSRFRNVRDLISFFLDEDRHFSGNVLSGACRSKTSLSMVFLRPGNEIKRDRDIEETFHKTSNSIIIFPVGYSTSSPRQLLLMEYVMKTTGSRPTFIEYSIIVFITRCVNKSFVGVP